MYYHKYILIWLLLFMILSIIFYYIVNYEIPREYIDSNNILREITYSNPYNMPEPLFNFK
jgi:hypothetical protein